MVHPATKASDMKGSSVGAGPRGVRSPDERVAQHIDAQHRAEVAGAERGRHARVVARIVLALVLAFAAVGLAAILQRRERPDPPVRTGYARPEQVDRADFLRPDAPWLVAVFTSATCTTCSGVWDRARHLQSDAVAVQELEYMAERALHDRYAIEAVPTTLIVDADGVVQHSFLGPVTATDLWAAVAEAREPGSTPGGCASHDALE